MKEYLIHVEARTWKKSKPKRFSIVFSDKVGDIFFMFEFNGDKQTIECYKYEEYKRELTILARQFYIQKDTELSIFDERHDMGEFYFDIGSFGYDKYILPILRDKKINQILQ